MKFFSPSSVLGGLLALAAGLFLTSCGGGGAQGNPAVTGAVQISPATGTFYAGIPYTFTLSGGRRPYSITSSEPSLMPVPSTVDGNSFQVLPANPGVIDPNLPQGSLPVKTVNITVRAGDGQTTAAAIQVGQNFLTGYGVNFGLLSCPIPGTPPTAQACAGGESAVTFSATFAGNLGGDRTFTLQAIKGNFQFVGPPGTVGNPPNSITTVSDHAGHITAVISVPAGTPTQIAVLRVIDTATGVYTDNAFIITGVAAGATLTVLPDTLTFPGVLSTDCGGGSGTFVVVGGAPPYTAVSSSSRIVLSNTTSNTNPGQFTVNVSSSAPPCATGSVVVTDAVGNSAKVDVSSTVGAGAPPTPATFTVVPNAITLSCGQSGSVTAVGGSGNYSTSSTSPNVTATVSGGTITITRAAVGNNASATSTVTVTDGTNALPVTVTSPIPCP